MKRLILPLAIVLGLAGGIGLAGLALRGQINKPPEPTEVRVEPAALGTLYEVVSAPGTVVPETKVSLSARLAARIVELPLLEGSTVKKNESVLVKLDSADAEADLRAAVAREQSVQAQLAAAEAQLAARRAQLPSLRVQLDAAKRELERQRTLLAGSDVAQQAVDKASDEYDGFVAKLAGESQALVADERALEVQKFNRVAAAAQVDQARDRLSYTTIISPIDGTVTSVKTEVGELAVTGTMNNPGTVIMEVADLSRMLVKARVDETDIAKVAVGQPVEVRVQAYPEATFRGEVVTVPLSQTDVKEDRSTHYEVEVLLTDTGGTQVLSGLTADVEIRTRAHPDAMLVPSQAVLGRLADALPTDARARPEVDPKKTIATVVYRLVDGKAQVVPVRVGPSDLTHTLIEGGVGPGDGVIVGPYKALEGLEHDAPLKQEAAASSQPASRPS